MRNHGFRNIWNRVANAGLSTLNLKKTCVPKNKIRESVHRYKLQVLITGSGAVHNVPLQYSV